MKSHRGIVLFAVALVTAGVSGAAGMLARLDAAGVPGLPNRPLQGSPLGVKPLAVPDCSDQDDDDDDDRDEAKAGKPDTDLIELQCGHQDADDDEVEDGPKHEKRGGGREEHKTQPPAHATSSGRK